LRDWLPILPDWEKERVILVQSDLWPCYCKAGHDVRPVFRDLIKAFASLGVEYRILSKVDEPLDIWIRDWGFVEHWWFQFNPDYAPKLYGKANVARARLTLAKLTGRQFKRVPLVLDGGNLVHNGQTAIVTEKVFTDNLHLTRREIDHLFCSLAFERVIFVPVEPEDVIGHIDGILRFLSKDILLFNDYRGSSFARHKGRLLDVLRSAHLDAEFVPFPWYCTDQEHDGVSSADGCYINFIQTKRGIVYPRFGHRLDDSARKILAYYSNQPVCSVEAKALAAFGGVLNCVSLIW
jgi:agmatine deiminase